MPKTDKVLSLREAAHAADGRSAAFLEKMNARLSALGKIGVWECDLATDTLTWTDAVYDLFELPRQSLLDRDAVVARYEMNSRREMERRRARAIETCSSFTVDVALRTAQGNARWIRINGDIECEDGRAVRIFGTKQDITAERVAQLRVQALQTELIHGSRVSAIEAMRATLAHELNQPLTAMRVYLSALRRIVANATLDSKAGDALDGMARCTATADGIIGGMDKIWGNQPLQARSFDVDQAIREASMIALAGAAESISLTHAGDDELMGWGDPVQIQQVVINLIRNARDAVTGCARQEITITMAHNAGFAEVSIGDSGPGIAAEVRDNLFHSFVSTKATGTGIGLAISRTIIEAHGGRLTAANTPGGGATFRFTLPIAPASGRTGGADFLEPAPGRPATG